MSEKNITLPSVLAFERKLEVSDGLMYAGLFDNRLVGNSSWQAIPVTKRLNRSTISSPGIKDGDKVKPNPVASGDDQAVIPSGCDTLKLSWTMRVIGKVGEPFACNKNDFKTSLAEKISGIKETAIQDLAFRYAYNIANGRFLWRNRVCAENVEIQVTIKGEKEPLIFNAYDFSLRDFEQGKDDEGLKKVTEAIKQGLMDETGENFTSLKINAFVKLDEFQQIFPSQEMNMGEKGKTLFQLHDCAAMHNVKIGNAIRTIDTWYSDKAITKAEGKDKVETVTIDERRPIAIEPYGSVTQQGMAYRPSKDDLYSLMLDWINEKNEKKISDDNKKYVIANLIRGGVFSKGDNKDE